MKLGFIGCGNMAKAIIKGIVKSEIFSLKEIIASTASEKSMEKAKKELGIKVVLDNKEVASKSEILFLAVKPHFYKSVIEEISSVVKKDTIIISMAPGQTIEKTEKLFGKDIKLVRSMPNTPAMVGEGMTALCANDFINVEEKDKVQKIMEGFGKAIYVEESMMEAVIAVSGSSPAYVFIFIEALADGAVLLGMSRKDAYEFAAQAVVGSAKMILETGMHPGELKDMVCSPGGTTIEAVKVLEEEGFRNSVIKAMLACGEKSKKM